MFRLLVSLFVPDCCFSFLVLTSSFFSRLKPLHNLSCNTQQYRVFNYHHYQQQQQQDIQALLTKNICKSLDYETVTSIIVILNKVLL